MSKHIEIVPPPVFSESQEIEVLELAEDLEEKFGGFIAQDAERIARFVVARSIRSVHATEAAR